MKVGKFNMQEQYSVGIVTYGKRFEKYFKPLIYQIKSIRPDIEILVCINGEHKDKLDDNYRKEMLLFLSNFSNIYPTFHPKFRSLSKLWNTCLINSSNKNILLLNDDISIKEEFFPKLEDIITLRDGDSFKLNGSWSHAFLNREQVNEVGWFDERYLAVGEEDADFEWRWQDYYKKSFTSISIPGLQNHVEQNDCLAGMKIANRKYSLFNLQFSRQKYQDSATGCNYGIMNRVVEYVDKTPLYHQGEKFYWDHKTNL